MISMSYKKLPVDVKPGNVILCSDGTISLMVLSCDPEAGAVRSIPEYLECIEC
jgi:pyruvate kinase